MQIKNQENGTQPKEKEPAVVSESKMSHFLELLNKNLKVVITKILNKVRNYFLELLNKNLKVVITKILNKVNKIWLHKENNLTRKLGNLRGERATLK
jgi:hypothetical protein